jgi:hypothetical protein
MGGRRFLDLDRLAARFNEWIGATAIADKAAPGDARSGHDPSAIVGVLGELDRHYGEAAAHDEDESLLPLNLEPLAREKRDAKQEIDLETEAPRAQQ